MDDEPRSERVSVSIAPSVMAKLKAHAREHRWNLSQAAAVLIEDGLAADADQEQEAGAR